MQISVKVTPSFNSLGNKFNDLEVESILRDEIYKIALKIERASKQLTPVDTGRLRSSIATGMLINKTGAFVSTNVNYAIFVHEGTRYMRGRPFMEMGANIVKGQIEGDIKGRLDAEFVKSFKTL